MFERARLFCFNGMLHFARDGKLAFLPDALFLRAQYWLKLGRVLHLKHPRLYNEKLQWIKLYDRKPAYSTIADKLAVRDYVRERLGEGVLIPLIAEYDRVDQIDWAVLPDRFVIKCTHGSSSNIIVIDKSKLDVEDAKRKLNLWMGRNWFNLSREWPYKEIPPRIIVEQFIGAENGKAPFDYKIMCFSGKPAYVIVDADRFTGHTRNFYDTNWIKQDIFNRHPNISYEIERPAQLAEMLSIAQTLSQGFAHIRVDLYVALGRVYFGEMTFFHGYGMEVYRPESFERHLGDLISLPAPADKEPCAVRRPS